MMHGQANIDSWSWPRSHSDTPHSVGRLWASDQSDAETSTRKHNTLKAQKTLSEETVILPYISQTDWFL